MPRRLLLVCTLIAATAPPARAQADTLGNNVALFTFRDGLFAAGILASARLIHPLDDHLAKRLQDSSTQANERLQKLSTVIRTTVAPGAYILGGTLYLSGRIARNPKLADIGLHSTEALVVGEITATLIKGITGRARPFVGTGPNDYGFGRGFGNNRYKAFPSGHSVAAFAAAAAVTSETSRNAPNSVWLVAPLMYGGAALAGASRMYNNQHWASDVIVGAGIGTLAGLKVVRYHHSRPGKGLDRWLLSGSLVPTPDGGHSVQWSVMPGGLTNGRFR